MSVNEAKLTDYRELLTSIEPSSISLIFTDPDYGVGRISKEKWGNNFNPSEFFDLASPLMADNGAIILFAAKDFYVDLVIAARDLKFKYYDLIWKKDRTTDFLNSKRWPLRNHEHIGVFYKKPHAYYPHMWEGIAPHSVGKALGTRSKTESLYGNHNRVGRKDKLKYPRTVFEFKAVTNSKVVYPFQKPIALCEEVILNYSQEGDTIIDCFTGSGSISVAAKRKNRKFIAGDNDETAVSVTNIRLKDYKNQNL